ncbi:unnamed protein product [Spirodela intermedia]|uniref:Uncharacterized protein n=1 Tax=Spirodela intermedia TaxID=51605 RepID=A0A7I8K6L6_SPIIN|nr:unnamed protein product [Spirodela intermedia]
MISIFIEAGSPPSGRDWISGHPFTTSFVNCERPRSSGRLWS